MPRFFIFNRAPAVQDGYLQIVPSGQLPNPEAGINQVLDDMALDSIYANLLKDKNRLGDNWPGLYAGREHFIYDASQDSAALAWFKDFQKRPDGIWASEDGLTPAGADALKNREYKYTSFVADPGDLQNIPGTSNGLPNYRVMRIDTVGFTNYANGKELLTPITNRASVTMTTAEDGSALPVFNLQDLDAFCQAVKQVMDVSSRTGTQMLPLPAAWTYCKAQFPELFNAAFGADDADSADDVVAGDSSTAGKRAQIISNRVARMSGKTFDSAWNFIRAELPLLFNRMASPQGRVVNRRSQRIAQINTPNAAKVFNRLKGRVTFFVPILGTAFEVKPHIFGAALHSESSRQ